MQVVESDLRLISVESRKRWPRVKEAAERGILWAHSYRGTEKGKDLTQVLLPLILCLETNDEKLVVYGLSALQKLLSHSFVPSEEMGKFLAKLEELARGGFEQAHLKVLQTIVTLLSTLALSDADLNKALTICFVLHERGSPAVGHIASASLRQCLAMLLDAGAVRAAAALLADLCALALGEPVLWLVAVPQLEQSFCLEMIETVIAHPLAASDAAMLAAVRAAVCPMLHRVLQVLDAPPDARHVRLTLRVLRVVRTLLGAMARALTAETEVIVSKVGRWMADGNDITWHHAALLEVVHGWFATPHWLAGVFEAYDVAQLSLRGGGADATPVCALLLRSVGRVAQLTWRWSSADMDDGPPTGALLDGAHSALPAWALARPRVTRLLVDCCDAAATAVRAAPLPLRGALVAAAWPPLSGALACVLGKAPGPAHTASCAAALAALMAATLDAPGAANTRDAIAAALVKACEECEAAKRPAQLRACTDALLAGVRAVRGQLSATAWQPALAVLLRASDPAGEPLTDDAADALVALGATDTIAGADDADWWTASAALSDEGLTQFVAALSALAATALAAPALATAQRVWPAGRLCAVLLLCAAHAERPGAPPARGVAVATLWREAAPLLLSVCSHASAGLRAPALQTVSALCTRGAALSCVAVAALQLLRALGLSLFADVRAVAMRAVEQCVRARGHRLGAAGWTPALQAVSEAAAHGKRDEVARGFAVLQLVVEELLPDVGSEANLLILVHAIGCYALQDADGNASLTTPALVWSLAHHVMTLAPAAWEPLWEPLLRLLAASARDATREEVRAGGLRTLFKMVELYHGQWSAALWRGCCAAVLVPLLGALAAAAPSGRPLPEPWLHTLALAATGCASLPPGPGLRAALLALLVAALCAPVAFAPAPQRPRAALQQLLAAYATLLERGGADDAPDAAACWAALRAPWAVLLERARAEAAELEAAAAASATQRFSHYFVLVDATRFLLAPAAHCRSPADAAAAAQLLGDALLWPALYSDTVYRAAGVLYDPAYKPHSQPPLIGYSVAAVRVLGDAAAGEPAVWAALALMAAHCVAGLVAALRGVTLLGAAPAFPPDPDPCVLAPALRRASALALAELATLAARAPCPPPAVPLLAHVLGCLLQLTGDAELAAAACACFVRLCDVIPPLRASPLLLPLQSCLIDVAERSLLTSLEAHAALAGPCAAALAGPLACARATDALLAVCRGSSGASAAAALAALLQLAPRSPAVAEHALLHCATVLRSAAPAPQLLQALRALRLPREAWPSAPSRLPPDDGRGLTHLLLLYHPLVEAAACPTASAEARRLAAACLHEAAASMGLPPQ